MTSMNESDLILKQDAGGRVFVPAGRQIELVQEFERSGLSAPKFAAMAGVKYQTFVTWRRKHGTAAPVRRRSAAGMLEDAAWMEAMVATPTGASRLTLRLPGGAIAEITHQDQLPLAVLLLKSIAAMPC
jgi:hypothetical protein